MNGQRQQHRRGPKMSAAIGRKRSDEPRQAVKDADRLAMDVTKRLTDMFAKERTGAERQWDRGDNVTTEDLRVALQRYHTFFDRLLAV
jgi:hypothetical protein